MSFLGHLVSFSVVIWGLSGLVYPPLRLSMYLIVEAGSGWNTFSPSARLRFTTSSGVFPPSTITYIFRPLHISVLDVETFPVYGYLETKVSSRHDCLLGSPTWSIGHPIHSDLRQMSAHAFRLQLECFCRNFSCQFLRHLICCHQEVLHSMRPE